MHFPGVIYLRDNDTVYIDSEAIVFGSIFSRGAKNVKTFGGGMLDNSCEERMTENCYENHTNGAFRIYNCSNIDISDIILTNSSTWALSMFECSNINIDNVKRLPVLINLQLLSQTLKTFRYPDKTIT